MADKEKVLATLTRLNSEIDKKIEHVNSGGCCVVAAIVGEELQKIGVEPEVIVSGDHLNLDALRTNIKDNTSYSEWRNNGVGFYHVGLRFKLGRNWYTYDADVILPGKTTFGADFPCHAAKGHFTVDEAKAFAKDGEWNAMFNRRQIPKLRKLVKQAFKEMDHA